MCPSGSLLCNQLCFSWYKARAHNWNPNDILCPLRNTLYFPNSLVAIPFHLVVVSSSLFFGLFVLFRRLFRPELRARAMWFEIMSSVTATPSPKTRSESEEGTKLKPTEHRTKQNNIQFKWNLNELLLLFMCAIRHITCILDAYTVHPPALYVPIMPQQCLTEERSVLVLS